MKRFLLSFILIFLLPWYYSVHLFGQSSQFEIQGYLKGQFKGRIYLFYEGGYNTGDTVSSEIIGGKFYFKGTILSPRLGRLCFGQRSVLGDFYIVNSKIEIHCSNKLIIKNSDTLNLLRIINTTGSQTEELKSSFEKTVFNYNKSGVRYCHVLCEFIKLHPNSIVSAYLVSTALDLSYKHLKIAYSLLDTTSLNSSYEQKAAFELLINKKNAGNSSDGSVFKNFTLKDTSGLSMNTSQFNGKNTLFVFWASWCLPCRRENPDLNQLYKQTKERNFVIVGISSDQDIDKWKVAIGADKLSWIQLIDNDKEEMRKYYGINGIPANILIDPQGRIIGSNLTVNEVMRRIN